MIHQEESDAATRLHYAISAVEDSIVSILEESFKRAVPDATITTYMFDGMVLHMREQDLPAIESVLQRVWEANRVGFTMKKFPVVDAAAD